MVKGRQNALLQRLGKIDQHFRPTDQIDPGKRRVRSDVMTRKHAEVVNRFVDPIALILFDKETPQALWADLRFDGFGVKSQARFFKSTSVSETWQIFGSAAG